MFWTLSARADRGQHQQPKRTSDLLAEVERHEADIFRRGMQQGEARGKATSILSILAARGIAIAADVRSRILSYDNMATLDAWLIRAVTVSNADSLFHSN